MQPFKDGYEYLTCKMWEDHPQPREEFDLVAEQRSILDAPTQHLVQMRFSDYRAFVERMRTGTLLHEDQQKDVFPVSAGRNEVWETKPFGEDDLARMYHGEPPSALQVVLLLCHMKVIEATQELTNDGQTDKIGTAINRYDAGADFQWGNRPVDSARREELKKQAG